MPNIGVYHPAIVHFAVALLVVGVIFRWISLTGRAAFTGPAAFLKADAYIAAGKPDSARATLEQLARDFPDVQRIKDRLAEIK
jgi:hypothetical protein